MTEEKSDHAKNVADLMRTPPSDAPYAKPMGTSPEPLLQFFSDAGEQATNAVVREIDNLARHAVAVLPRNPERTILLRALLDARQAVPRVVAFVS